MKSPDTFGRRDVIIEKSNFRDHPCARQILEKIDVALYFFPELSVKPITVGRFGTVGSTALAMANSFTWSLMFNVQYMPSYNTIFHELAHLLKGVDRNMPSGEEATTIYGLSRIPDNLIDSYSLPYIGFVPKHKVGCYCRGALIQRNVLHNRRYIKWLKDTIDRDRRSDPSYPKSDCFDERAESHRAFQTGKTFSTTQRIYAG